ncbi:CPBP family intramembrane glutamic endopeptidase [Natronorubrum bangense]|uniref:Abortive infection protein n=2 Tax=Natronorubrum bangense TaxID=61858 RepID=L9WK33_9EURY|nr:CPBP family intramembrane glutamic endopeptidase [Natronorubrum bangense]ELY49757.1 Abortive infection protein [Natronorubrum bangense JCM 10635]QCC55385.1 CPBP family intramembrane metalloprotease [Natronorubrum bangense]
MAESTVDRESNRSASDTLLYGSSDTRLRATWRVLAPLIVAIALYVTGHALLETVVTSVLETWMKTGETSAVVATAGFFIGLSITIALSAVAGLLVASRLDHRPVSSYGFARSRGWIADFAAGILIGVAASAGAVGYQAARGDLTLSVSVTGVGVDSAALGGLVLVVVLVFLLVNNVFEEVVFRAILIPNAAAGLYARFGSRSIGATVVVAVAVSLPVFGALHVLGGGLAAIVTSAIGGILFATAYVLTGRLGLPIGVHFGGIAALSLEQQPLAADPELTLPSVVVAEWVGTPSLLVSVELWTVRLLLGVVLVCVWVYATYGDLSITERVFPADADFDADPDG